MGTDTISSLTGAACSLALHALVGALCLLNLDWGASASRTPEVFMVSLAPVLYHTEELSQGSPSGTTLMPRSVPAPKVPSPALKNTVEAKPVAEPRAMLKPKKQTQPVPSAMQRTAEKPTRSSDIESMSTSSSVEHNGNNPGALLGQNGTASPGSGNYETLVVSHLTNAKRYPERARRRGIEGDVVVDIELARDGSLARAKLVSLSNWEVLNAEVLEMVRRAAPFPPVPHNYRPGQRVGFTIPIRFQLQ